MKKILTLAALALALCTPAAFADNTQQQTVAQQSCGAGKLWVPPGSNVVSDGAGALDIQAPGGWIYIGQDGQGMASMMAGTKCSCDCTSTSGNCSPSIFNGDCSCTAKDGCTSCSLSTSASVAVLTDHGVEVVGPAVESVKAGGYVNLRAGVHFATAADGDLPMVFAEMFKLAPVAAALENFFVESNLSRFGAPEMVRRGDGFVAPEGFQLAKVNVLGRAGLVLVPNPWNEGPAGMMVGGGGGGGNCSCTSGSCTYDSSWTPKGTLYYCTGNCSGTCTLSMKAAATTNQLRDISRSAN